MSTIKSSDEHLTLNADGSSKDIKFQANGVEKASISSAGAFTSTTIDATKLTGALPAISGAALTGVGVAGISSSADATAITIDSSENVGIGVVPSNWPSNGDHRALQIGTGGAIYGRGSGDEARAGLTANVYLDATDDRYEYIGNSYATHYRQSDGNHSFWTAPSGSANGAITFTNRLEIKEDGRGLSQFTAKAWINFNGQISTPSIYDSHNVSSITDNAAAQYTINFSNNMANDDYCAVAHAHAGGGTNDVNVVQMPVSGRAVGSVGCHVMSALNTATTFSNGTDSEVTDILIFGD